jgi:hypothetical protein
MKRAGPKMNSAADWPGSALSAEDMRELSETLLLTTTLRAMKAINWENMQVR